MRVRIEFQESVKGFTSEDLMKELKKFSLIKAGDCYEIENTNITELLSAISDLNYTGILKLAEDDSGDYCRLILDKFHAGY